MVRWEYMQVLAQNASAKREDVQALTENLRLLGERGWEVVSVVAFTEPLGLNNAATCHLIYVLKRPVAAPDEVKTTHFGGAGQ